MYSKVITVNNIVVHIWKLPREYNLKILITHTPNVLVTYGNRW